MNLNLFDVFRIPYRRKPLCLFSFVMENLENTDRGHFFGREASDFLTVKRGKKVRILEIRTYPFAFWLKYVGMSEILVTTVSPKPKFVSDVFWTLLIIFIR